MPEVRDEDMGRRLFIANQEKAVEEAVVRVQRALGHAWTVYTSSDIRALKRVFGEVWGTAGREEWATYTFSRLGREDLERLIAVGRESGTNHRIESSRIMMARDILQKTR